MTAVAPTVAAPPNTNDVAIALLSGMESLAGVATDYNKGSQIRTMSEAAGAVIEQQGIGAQAQTLQAIAFSAMSIFNIVPNAAVPAIGTVTFVTSTGGSPPPASQTIPIPQGTIVQTAGGIQYVTTLASTINIGSSSINVPVQAVMPGTTGNQPPGSITVVISGLIYPLSVTNAQAITGGADAESPSQALSRLSAKIASINSSSPVALSNGLIGVQAVGSSETVMYATCYEPWILDPADGAGFTMYIDNGTGAASSGLIAAAVSTLNGNQASGQLGYRPGGVPYNVAAVVPVLADVVVQGTINGLGNSVTVSGAMTTAADAYFNSLLFGVTAYQGNLAAAVSNAALGVLTSLSVTLSYASTSGVAVTAVTGVGYTRVILNNLSINLTAG